MADVENTVAEASGNPPPPPISCLQEVPSLTISSLSVSMETLLFLLLSSCHPAGLGTEIGKYVKKNGISLCLRGFRLKKNNNPYGNTDNIAAKLDYFVAQQVY